MTDKTAPNEGPEALSAESPEPYSEDIPKLLKEHVG